jgi:hypothetical protein
MRATQAARYRVNQAKVVHEVFEDEVLVVNLDSGIYYSLLGPSARVWLCIQAGASLAETIRALSEAYEGDTALMVTALESFIHELVDENLVLPADEATGTSALPIASGSRKPFEPLLLQKFTDMQELLLLDPVHDVEDAGWPLAKPQPPTSFNP